MPFTKETSRKALVQRWEKSKGIKLLFFIRPVGKVSQATGVFRGKEINVTGKNNRESLDNLFKVLRKEM